MPIAAILSGGQTGVDRAALEFAVAAGIPYRGWCPRGGWAEDLPAPPGVRARYPALTETPSADPAQRTRWNVRDADGVLVVGPTTGSQGTQLTIASARELDRPWLAVTLGDEEEKERAAAFVAALAAGGGGVALVVAGARESECPGIAELAMRFLEALRPVFVRK